MSDARSQSVDAAVADAAQREPAVLAAYLFGSRARGEARERSDLDVAVLEMPGRELDLRAEDRMRRSIASATGLPVDFVRLRAPSPVLAFEVLSENRRVFSRDAALADEIEERLLLHYLDTEHLRRIQREYFFGDES
jgi:predicted nucleotidyltransferase